MDERYTCKDNPLLHVGMDKEQFGFLTPTKGGDDKNMYHVGWLLIHPNDNSLNRFGNFDPD